MNPSGKLCCNLQSIVRRPLVVAVAALLLLQLPQACAIRPVNDEVAELIDLDAQLRRPCVPTWSQHLAMDARILAERCTRDP